MSKNEPFAPWQCPLCGERLIGDSTLKCTKGHCFDRAKEGYWHLLPVQSMRTKAPGDSKEMVAARRAFLNAGYYGIFGRALGELCLEYGLPAAPDAPLHLLDAGCGEGWYDRCIAQAFAEKGSRVQLAGFDIAKPAVRLAAKALPTAQYAVASSFSQPVTKKLEVDEEAASIVRRIFAMCAGGSGPSQIARILKKEQILTPTMYAYTRFGITYVGLDTQRPYHWSGDTVADMLENEIYLGNTVNMK